MLWESITKLPSFPSDTLVTDSLKLALEHHEKHQSISEEVRSFMFFLEAIKNLV